MTPTVDPTRRSTPPLIALRDLWVTRGSRDVLCGVTAEIARGRVTALVGLNGCGKSTLLRTLVGEFAYRGRIEFRCGHDHSRPRPEYVGYVPQRLAVDPRLPLTVRDLFGLAMKRGPIFFGLGKALTEKIRGQLDQVGVADLIDVPVEGLSGGQLQRVLLAMALEPRPELLLLDEPTSGIDFKTQQAFYELIADLNRRTGVTVLLVSHDLSVVRQFAHRALCLHEGTIRAQGSPAEVLTPDALQGVFGNNLPLLTSPTE